MKEESIQALAFQGGPLHRLGCRLGLIRGGTNSFWLGVALALLAWGVLSVLTLLLGVGPKVFSLPAVGAHARLMVAIPLFFLCETWVFPRMTEFARDIGITGLVPAAEMQVLASATRRVNRLTDSWLAEIVFVILALALPLIGTFIPLPGRTADLGTLLTEAGGKPGLVLDWYIGFCLPLFRFLMFRWVWRLGLWCYFLWRVQKLNLHLVPTHPDCAGGLGYLEVVQEHFTPLAASISVVYAASFAEEMAAGTMAFEALYRMIPLLLLVVAVLFAGPLFFFSAKLWMCRVNGWREYMAMASRYTGAFDRKWIQGENPSGEALLGTPDMQSLADLNNSVNVVRNVQVIPASRRLLVQLAGAMILPLLPLLFFKYPIADLAAKLFQSVTGL